MKYGIFGFLTTTPGQRQEFISILEKGTKDMPGCIRYDISIDGKDPNKMWIYELWETQDHHERSLMLPAVRNAIGLGRHMIAEFGDKTEFVPLIY